MAMWRCKVVGAMPIRDALTKRDVTTGDEVVLNDAPVARKPGADGRVPTPWAGTLIAPLVEAGCIEVLGPYVEPATPKAKTEA